MSRCRIITWSLLLAVAALVALAWLSFREPRAGGESLSYWLKLGANPAGTGDDAPSIPQSEAAIREIGPKAIPTLLAKLRTTDAPWKQKTYQLLNKQNFHSFEFVWPHQENAEGIYGFAVLGSNALPALPALEIMFWDTNTSWQAGQALGHIGLVSLPILRAGFTNSDRIFRWAALHGSAPGHLAVTTLPDMRQLVRDPDTYVALGAFHRLMQFAAREEATQLVIENLEGNNTRLRTSALNQLGRVDIETNRVIPVLVRLLDKPDVRFQHLLTNTLKRLDPVAAAAAGINTNPPPAFIGRRGGRGRGRAPITTNTTNSSTPR